MLRAFLRACDLDAHPYVGVSQVDVELDVAMRDPVPDHVEQHPQELATCREQR
jgi:hypothetical protein